MKSRAWVMAVGLIVLIGVAQAVALAVPRVVVGTGVEDRAPVGVGMCFSEVTGAGEGSRVVHIWYFGEEEQLRITLPVRGDRWRTWSQKRINPGHAGAWRVVVEGPDGAVLAEVAFEITE